MFAASRSSATARGRRAAGHFAGPQLDHRSRGAAGHFRRPAARPSIVGGRTCSPPRSSATGRTAGSRALDTRSSAARTGEAVARAARSAAIAEDDEHVRRLQAGQPGGRRGPARSTPAAPPRGRAKLSRARCPGRRRSPTTRAKLSRARQGRRRSPTTTKHVRRLQAGRPGGGRGPARSTPGVSPVTRRPDARHLAHCADADSTGVDTRRSTTARAALDCRSVRRRATLLCRGRRGRTS